MTQAPTTESKTKTCPFCKMTDVPAAATRCPHCAGDIGHHELMIQKSVLDHLIELELAETISIGEVALLEPEIPGIGAAVSRWLHEIE